MKTNHVNNNNNNSVFGTTNVMYYALITDRDPVHHSLLVLFCAHPSTMRQCTSAHIYILATLAYIFFFFFVRTRV